MPRLHVCLELEERKLHILSFLPETNRGKVVNLNRVRFETVPILGGWLEQGQVRSQILTEVLTEVRIAHKLPLHTPVRVALPLVNGFIREYRLPWISPRHRDSAIQYLAKEETPIPQNNQVFGYTVIKADKKSNQMMVTLGATRRSIVESLQQCLKGAGFEARSVEFSASALAFALGPSVQERYLYMSESNDGIQITRYRGNIPEITRFFPIYPGNDPEEWLTEIARSFGLMNETPEEQVGQIFISGQRVVQQWSQKLLEAGLPGLQKMTELLSIEQIAQEWTWRGSLPQNVFSCLPCIGLALNWKLKGNTQGVNLLAEYHQKRWKRHQEFLVSFLLLVFLLGGIGFWQHGRNQQVVLGAEVKELKMAAEKFQAKEQKEKHLVEAWNGIKRDKAGVSPPLISLQSLNGQGVQFEQLEYKEGMLTLQGTVERAGQLEQLLKELQNQAWEQVRFRQYHQERTSSILFTVTAVQVKH